MQNQNIKILLSIVVQGGTLVRQGEKEVIKFVITKQEVSKKVLPESVGKQIIKSGKSSHYNKVAIPAIKYIKMSMDAYNHFISDYTPTKVLRKVWKKMNATQRLEWHLQNTCEHYGGISYTYEVLED